MIELQIQLLLIGNSGMALRKALAYKANYLVIEAIAALTSIGK
jgi:hypothetical protein